jgi:hypothetical protein
VEVRRAVLSDDYDFAVDQERVCLKAGDFDNGRKAVGPVVAVPGETANAQANPAHYKPIAIVLDFVNPGASRKAAGYLRRQARFDEAGGKGHGWRIGQQAGSRVGIGFIKLRRTFVAELLTDPRTSFGNGEVHRFDSDCDTLIFVRIFSSERHLPGADMVRPAMGGCLSVNRARAICRTAPAVTPRLGCCDIIALPFSIGADSHRAAGARTRSGD